MSQMNVFNLAYLAFRVGPFIMVFSFILLSILNFDIKCVIYLAGLMLAIMMTRVANSMVTLDDDGSTPDPKCGIVSLGEDDSPEARELTGLGLPHDASGAQTHSASQATDRPSHSPDAIALPKTNVRIVGSQL